MTAQKFFLQCIQFFVEDFPIISMFLRIEIQVQIYPALFSNDVAFVRPFLFVIPGNRLGKDVQFQIAVVVLVMILLTPDFPNELLGKT